MDRRDILAERPLESGRGFMPGVSLNPSRMLFTAGLTGRNPDGKLVSGGMGPQARRAFERLQAILSRADAKFDNVVKQLVYVTDLEAYNASGRPERAKFFGSRPASTGLVVRRLADPAMLIEVELVVDLGGSSGGKPLLEKYNVENHGGDFYQGVIVTGGRLLYLAGQVANNPDGSVAGAGDWQRQAEKVYENIAHVLRAAGASAASVVKETTWVLSIESWRQHGAPGRRGFYKTDFPASTLVEIPGLARPEFLVEIEVIAAIA
ncbi:MAG TPA: RidA family protein [Candidatus Methylomirabilis sp.]|nr:RidA family protein [Candidatus Methylomirabilis sp.]